MRYIQIVAALIILLMLSAPVHTVLQISLAKSGDIVLEVPVREREEFTITFIHSVNRRPVIDYYRIEGSEMVVFKSRYDSFGAGMPEASIDGMELKSEVNGMLELSNINRRLDKVIVFVGTIAQHSLQIKQDDIPLSNLAPPGQPLEFKIAQISYLQLWRGRIINERPR